MKRKAAPRHDASDGRGVEEVHDGEGELLNDAAMQIPTRREREHHQRDRLPLRVTRRLRVT